MKLIVLLTLAISAFLWQPVNAAKENGSAKTIKKLQMMVQEATADRDRLSNENAKIAADLAQAKKDLEQEKKAKTEFESKEKKLNSDILAQKGATDAVRLRLDETMGKLHEVIEKYNTLNQSKNELAVEYGSLKNTQQFTSAELKACEAKNIKMYEGAKAIVIGYDKCQDKSIVDTLMDSEPFSQIKSVEFETVVQEYEDKLRKQKFQPSESPKK